MLIDLYLLIKSLSPTLKYFFQLEDFPFHANFSISRIFVLIIKLKVQILKVKRSISHYSTPDQLYFHSLCLNEFKVSLTYFPLLHTLTNNPHTFPTSINITVPKYYLTLNHLNQYSQNHPIFSKIHLFWSIKLFIMIQEHVHSVSFLHAALSLQYFFLAAEPKILSTILHYLIIKINSALLLL